MATKKKPNKAAAFQSIDNSKQWDDWAANQPRSNFQLAWNWGAWPDKVGRLVHRRGLVDRGRLLAGYTAVVADSRRGRYLEIDGGLSLDLTEDQDRWQLVSDDLRTLGQSLGAIFVRLRPILPDNPQTRRALTANGWRLAAMPLGVEQAGILSLDQTDDEILAGCRQGLRRKLRQSQRWSDVDCLATTDAEVVDEFIDIHQQHSDSLGYVPFSCQRLKAQFEAFAAADQAAIYWSHKDGQTLAMNMMFFFGSEASYHYGVSTDLGRQFPTAPRLHLQAMADARQRGLSFYNFWGVVPVDQTQHRFFGVSQFKRSFGVVDYNYLPTHDLVLSPARYRLVRAFEVVRRRRRRL